MTELPLECRLIKNDFRPISGALKYLERTEPFVNKPYSDSDRPLVSAVTDRTFILTLYNIATLASPITGLGVLSYYLTK
ncbi:hypothetical protein J4230_03345 [Candidatus Woesearchaeota archaeon]|nr:hypothetical protein [Candidatus Woesearchaeota archaeon]